MYKCEFRADTKIVFDFELLMYLKYVLKRAHKVLIQTTFYQFQN